MEAGLDSLGAVELRNALSARLALDLPATVTLDFPSIGALAAHLATLVAPSDVIIGTDEVASYASSATYSQDLQVTDYLPSYCCVSHFSCTPHVRQRRCEVDRDSHPLIAASDSKIASPCHVKLRKPRYKRRGYT